MSTMLTTGEQQGLRRIEQELRDADRGFAWRLGVFQGMLRWARPGRQAYLLALAVLAVAVLCLAAAPRRLLLASTVGVVRMGSAALTALGDTAWPGWDSGPVPGHGASPPQDRRQSGGTDMP